MHKGLFLRYYLEQTVVQVSKTDKISLLWTDVAFCPLATVVNYFHYKNKEKLKHFCITLNKLFPKRQQVTTGYET